MKQRGSILSYAESVKSRNQTIAELVAIDNFTINQIVKSHFIKKVFKSHGWKMPKNGSTITKIITDEATSKKEKIKTEFANLSKQNVRFSCTIDEWTSLSSKRCMSIIIRSNEKIFNLGLAIITGSEIAINLNNILCTKLMEYGIQINSLVVIVTDGASVMKSLLTMNECISQTCMAHGFHLTVKDSFPKAANEVDDDETVFSDEERDEDHDLAIISKVINCKFLLF